MVRFRDFHSTRLGAGSPSRGAAAGGGRSESALTGKGPERGEAAVDPKSLYEDASFYMEKVFSAVRERKPFALDPGFRIARQIVESYCPGDPLFVRTIQIDDRHNYLVNKSINVAVYAVRLARQLGYAKQRQVEIGAAGLLHEVGMCLVPKQTIYKTEQLSGKDRKAIQQHSESGYHVLKAYSDSHPYLAEVALQIHERIDGSGYPQGLKGDEIHDYAQIVGLVDIYEALSHSRPHRDRFNHFSVVKEIINTCKTKFHKKHLKALLNAFSIFPLSTHVRLNSNAVGQVIETYPEQPMRPKLRIGFDSQGRKVLTERIVNLPENSLLYIVDSIADDEIEQLELGHPFQAAPGPLEEEDFSAPPAQELQLEDAPDEPEPSPPKRKAAGDRKPGGSPLLGLLLLVVLAVGLFAWPGRPPVARSSAEDEASAGIVRKEIREQTVASRADENPEPEAAASASQGAGRFRIETRQESAGDSQAAGPTVRAAAAPGAETPGMTVDAPPETGSLPAARRPYSLLLSSFRSEVLTKRAMSVYRLRGISPYWVKVDLGQEGERYRLFWGQYATAEEAAAAARALAGTEVTVKRTPFANLVAAGLSYAEADAILEDLQERGVSPYAVQNDRGNVDLFVGAFYTKKGAESQLVELLAKGVQTRVVER